MPVQAIPLALISSLYPLGLAAILLLAETPRPRPRVGVFLIGALACTLTVGFVVVFALHGAGVGQSSQRSDQYWLRLVSGVAFMAAAVVLARRLPKPHTGPRPMTMVLRRPAISSSALRRTSTEGCRAAPNEHPIQFRKARRPWERAPAGMVAAPDRQTNSARAVAELGIWFLRSCR